MVTLYRVGGCVRDAIMGVPYKDVDYAVECSSFAEMEQYIKDQGGVIYQSKPEFFTILAKVWGIKADFVLCRREGNYTDGRRPDTVEVGTIYDDLARRDFTVNAIAAKVIDGVVIGEYIDPYNGIDDIAKKIIRCVGNAYDRFSEDSLRILRAIRFAITKKFLIDELLDFVIKDESLCEKIKNVSSDRIREELHKCFAFDTLETLHYLSEYYYLRKSIFEVTNIWLKPTTESRN